MLAATGDTSAASDQRMAAAAAFSARLLSAAATAAGKAEAEAARKEVADLKGSKVALVVAIAIVAAEVMGEELTKRDHDQATVVIAASGAEGIVFRHLRVEIEGLTRITRCQERCQQDLAAQLALQGSMRARTLDRSREVSFANLTTQLKNVVAASTCMHASIFDTMLEVVSALSKEPAYAALVEAVAGDTTAPAASDNTAPVATSAAAAAKEADSASTGGGGPHAASSDAPPYQHIQGRHFDTTDPKDPAVVELLSTK